MSDKQHYHRKLHDFQTMHYKVLDIISTFSPTSSNITDKCTSLKQYTYRDNVHLTEKGYELLAENIIASTCENACHRKSNLPTSAPFTRGVKFGHGAAFSAPLVTAKPRAQCTSKIEGEGPSATTPIVDSKRRSQRATQAALNYCLWPLSQTGGSVPSPPPPTPSPTLQLRWSF